MIHKNILVKEGNHSFNIPEWFLFFSKIGEYLFKNPGTKFKKTHIAISLPGTPIVTLAVAIGMTDVIFNREFNSKSHANRIISLNKGQMIYYIKDDKREVCSFEGISQHHPFRENERSVDLIDSGNMVYRVAESDWDKLQIATEKNTYKRKKSVKGFGFTSKLLEEIYGNSKLLKAACEYDTEFYIVGNQIKIVEMANGVTLKLNNIEGSLRELLCLKNSYRHSYYHSEFVSGAGKLPKNFELEEGVPVIFTDAVSYLNRSHIFEKFPSIILLDRTENNERNEEVILDIKRRLLQGNIENITQDLLKIIKENGLNPPFEIEILAWREK